MTLACPVDLDVIRLRQEIRSIYGRVAGDPSDAFHFHRGAEYAIARLGYDRGALERLPAAVTDRFAGIANPHALGPCQAGETVLDVGCGAGTDLLLAALAVGPAGRAIGVDMTADMREQASAAAESLGLRHVTVLDGDAAHLPIDDASVSVVISNGVLNLVPEKEQAIDEIRRVLKPGGRVQISDIVLGVELDADAKRDIDLWTG